MALTISPGGETPPPREKIAGLAYCSRQRTAYKNETYISYFFLFFSLFRFHYSETQLKLETPSAKVSMGFHHSFSTDSLPYLSDS